VTLHTSQAFSLTSVFFWKDEKNQGNKMHFLKIAAVITILFAMDGS